MLRQELLYGADQQHVLNPSPSLFTALKFSHLLTSSTTCGTNFQEESSQQLGQSPLHSSEGSTSAATPPECSSSPVNFAHQQQQQQQQQASSIWADFLNGVPFMADETTLTPSSTGGGNTGPSTWWSSSSSSSASTTTTAGVITPAPPSSREQDLPQQWSNFSSHAPQASNSMPEMEASDWQLSCLATAPEVNEQLSKMAIESANVYSSIGTALVDADMTNNPSAWSSILMGGNGADDPTSALENTGVEGLHEALFSSKFNHGVHNNNGKNAMLKAKDEHSSPSWEFLKSPATSFELDELGMNPKLVQFLGQDARMELDAAGWSTMINEPSTSTSSQQRVSYAASTDAFGRQQQFDPTKIKQEFEAFNSGSSSSSSSSPMIPMQPHCDVVGSRPIDLQHMLNSTGETGGSNRWGNKFPAMLSQVLPSSTPSTTKQASLFGSSVGGTGTMIPNRPFSSTNYTSVKQEQQYKVHPREQSSMSQHSSVTSQHSFDSKDLLMEDTNREVSSDQKRGLAATTVDHSKATEPFFKRPRIEQQQNPSLPFKATAFVLQVRKEKLGERITALQQLVSPFGKTDTASVLLEAIGYIKFLHEQVQVLSTPYMKNATAATGGGGAAGAGPTIPSRPSERGSSSSSSSSSTSAATATELGEEQGRQDLRSRGLCLVPISCTMQVANNDNGADFWAPTIGGASGGAGNNSSGK